MTAVVQRIFRTRACLSACRLAALTGVVSLVSACAQAPYRPVIRAEVPPKPATADVRPAQPDRPIRSRPLDNGDGTVPGVTPAPALDTSPSAPVAPPAPARTTPAAPVPAAATGLLRTADQMIERNDLDAALTQLERAQRIAPRSPVVYYKLAEVHVQKGELAKAEQFTLKGISLAGQDRTVARAGWQLLADIRRARGNRQGSAEAQDKARALD